MSDKEPNGKSEWEKDFSRLLLSSRLDDDASCQSCSFIFYTCVQVGYEMQTESD